MDARAPHTVSSSLALAAAVWTLVRTIDRRQRRTRLPIELDEPPPEATQRLGLSG